MTHLTERGLHTGQDDHHGDVISKIRHLQQLDIVLRNVSVPEAGLLVHHVDQAGPTLADVEVCQVHIVTVELVLPLTLRSEIKTRQTTCNEVQ